MTFLLLFVVFEVAVNKKSEMFNVAPLAIGFAVFVAVRRSPYRSFSFNLPARPAAWFACAAPRVPPRDGLLDQPHALVWPCVGRYVQRHHRPLGAHVDLLGCAMLRCGARRLHPRPADRCYEPEAVCQCTR